MFVFGTIVTTWFAGLTEGVLPSPQRVWLTVENTISGEKWPAERRFRLVLCWLDDDYSGESTKKVAQAFSKFDGIDITRSAQIVTARGAGETWRSTMREKTSKILQTWHGDLAIVGLVKVPQRAITLWYIPRVGDDNLTRGDSPYELKEATLPSEFHNEIRLQLIALAFNEVIAAANIEVTGSALSNNLELVADKVENLLTSGIIGSLNLEVVDDQAEILLNSGTLSASWLEDELRFSLGRAFLHQGEHEIGTDKLERAVDIYRRMVEVALPTQGQGNWARAHMLLAVGLIKLGERKRDVKLVHQAINSNKALLEVLSREHQAFDWANTQNNLANALLLLGEWEQDSEQVKAAISAYHAAVEIYTRTAFPRKWAIIQTNLGIALHLLGELENDAQQIK